MAMSQPEKLSKTVTESPYSASPIDVEKGLGSTFTGPTSPSRRFPSGRIQLARPTLIRLILLCAFIFLMITLLTGGIMAKRHGSADPRTWNVDAPDNQLEEPKEAYPWECRKGLWSCRGLGLKF